MKLLEDRILKDGIVLPGDILKVDCFLNHMIDPVLLRQLGEEFGRLYKDAGITKILTVEASGIAVAFAASAYFGDCPVVFAKKGEVSTMSKDTYTADVHSYTRNKDLKLNVAKKFLQKEDTVLLVDDFLANGAALSGLLEIC